MTTAKKTTAARQGFKTGEAVVYPAHGVGRMSTSSAFLTSSGSASLRMPTEFALAVGTRRTILSINSGDLIAVTEVVRDLFRSDAQPEQSYSERQLYDGEHVERLLDQLGLGELAHADRVRLGGRDPQDHLIPAT
jgi:CarD family transcriptional regulator